MKGLSGGIWTSEGSVYDGIERYKGPHFWETNMKNGRPAFPVTNIKRGQDGPYAHQVAGNLSLRDWFAGMALQGLIINPKTCCPECPISARAYELADAMLKERENVKG